MGLGVGHSRWEIIRVRHLGVVFDQPVGDVMKGSIAFMSGLSIEEPVEVGSVLGGLGIKLVEELQIFFPLVWVSCSVGLEDEGQVGIGGCYNGLKVSWGAWRGG